MNGTTPINMAFRSTLLIQEAENLEPMEERILRREVDYFCIIGAQRSGTTYLYSLLDSHPEISMAKPRKPEPKHFINDKDYSKGPRYYLNKVFPPFPKNTRVIGEKSTSYFEYAFVAERIKQYFPKAKILLSLRNPADRALSNYFFSVHNGIETRTLEEVFIKNYSQPTEVKGNWSVSPFDYIRRGEYSRYLGEYMKVYGDDMLVVIFEDLVKPDNKDILNDIYKFLNVNMNHSLVWNELTKNESGYSLGKDPEMLGQVRERLMAYYRNEVLKTEDILNRPLDLWKR